MGPIQADHVNTVYLAKVEFYRTWVSSKNQHINIRAETKPISCTKDI